MGTLLFFIITIVVIMAGFTFFMFLTFRGRLSNGVTFAEMDECEDVIAKRYHKYATQFRTTKHDGSLDVVDITALTNELRLKVEQAELPSPKRCALEISDSPEYNGVIKFTKIEDKQYAENFDIMHEIVHYLKDVGVGKRVDVSFARTHHGNPRSHQEQVTDYYAAAMAIPRDSLKKKINAYQNDPHSEEFVEQMMKVYEQPRETIMRRINEVLSLS